LRPLDAYEATRLETRSQQVQKDEVQKAEKMSLTYNEKSVSKKAQAIIN
jgi:hypothetical protein